MKKLFLTLFFIFFALPVYALELLMAHNPGCHYCELFMTEVYPTYKFDHAENQPLTLVIISVYDQPEWFKQAYAEKRIKPIRGTPTFIIWNGRIELARIVGYGYPARFYESLRSIFPKYYD